MRRRRFLVDILSAGRLDSDWNDWMYRVSGCLEVGAIPDEGFDNVEDLVVLLSPRSLS